MPLATLSFLIADESPGLARTLSVILKSFGVAHVLTASSAAEGFALLRERRIDLAFVDMDLGGGGGGLRLVRTVRTAADSPDPHLPMIALCAHTSRAAIEAARDAGAHDVLAKPVAAAEVFRRLSAVVEQARPFVRTPGFYGPDRRRRSDPAYAGPERRRAADEDGDDGEAPRTAGAVREG